MRKRKILRFPLFFLYLLAALPIAAQTDPEYHLSEDNLKQGISIAAWKYHPGDNPDWAAPEFDDTSWEVADSRLLPGQKSRANWRGTGWFRMRLAVDPALLDRPLGLFLRQSGAANIYLNGERIYQFAGSEPEEMSRRNVLKPVLFQGKVDHVIAVRYSNSSPENSHIAGFTLDLGELNQFIKKHTAGIALDRSVQSIFTALPFAFGLLHLLLFLFFRRAIKNLYFAIAMFVIASATFFDYQSSLSAHTGQSLLYLRFHRVVLALTIISILRFMYSLFYEKIPLQFWILSAAAVVTGVFAVYSPNGNLSYLNTVFLIVIAEMFRANILAVYKKRSGAWILLTGFVIQIVFSLYDMFLDFKILAPVYKIENAYFIGTFGLIVCMSVYLARDFAKTRRSLEIYSRDLEGKVAERTYSLAEKNEELQTTLEQLTQTQTQLVQSGKMAALGNLAAGIAHEVNNPVSAVVSASDVMERGLNKVSDILQNIGSTADLKGDEQLRKMLFLISRNSQVVSTGSRRVAEIVQKLKDFARLDEAHYQRADIHEGIDSTLTLIQHELSDNVKIQKEYGDIPRINCYPNELNQVFMNLLINAAHAIEGKGTITIKTFSDERNVYVQVTDTGKGITPEDLDRIFEPGYTTKGDGVGVGLGLSISRNVIDKHNGEIHVDSEVGKGTAFKIILPME